MTGKRSPTRYQQLASTVVFLTLITVTLSVIPNDTEGSNAISERAQVSKDETLWAQKESITRTLIIPPGGRYVARIDETGKLFETMPFPSLSSNVYEALNLTPSWLREDLLLQFNELGNNANTFANIILNANNGGNARYVDELAFSIAHTGTDVLTSSPNIPQLLLENVQYIYGNDAYLPYVEVVDYPDHSTTRYKVNESGSINTYELPKEIYYWYVVEPKLSDDRPGYINPDTGGSASPPTGRFWREYLFHHNDSVYPDDSALDRKYPREMYPPLLKEWLEDVDTLWNATYHVSPRGFNNTGHNNSRPKEYGDHAIERISNWVCKTLPLNNQETGDSERPIQPVRIARHHNGNCGELQDLTAAAARTCLIPVMSTSNSGEDHVWNHFYERGWHFLDNWWSDGGTRTGDFSTQDRDQNGGKNISAVYSFRGDGYTTSVTPLYTPTCDIVVTVTDSAGDPVDGAAVQLHTNFHFSSDVPLESQINAFPTFWNYTDQRGKTRLRVGNVNTYWMKVFGPEGLGMAPAGEEIRRVGASPTVGGEVYNEQISLPSSKPHSDIDGTVAPEIAERTDDFRLDFQFTVEENILKRNARPRYYYEGWREYSGITVFKERFPGGDIDIFVTDSVNYTSYAMGENYGVYFREENEEQLEGSFVTPKRDSWYFVLTNEDCMSTFKKLNFTLNLSSTTVPTIKITSPLDISDLPLGQNISINGSSDCLRNISVVEINIDNKEEWLPATDIPDAHDWNRWSFEWETIGERPGLHILKARVTNEDGRQAYAELMLTLIDVTPPELYIIEPGDNSIYKHGEAITFSGDATDDVGIEELLYRLDNGPEMDIMDELEGSSWEFTLATGYLMEGAHRLSIIALDLEENAVHLLYNFILLEIIPPELEIEDPEDFSLYGPESIIEITGEASDENGIDSLQGRLYKVSDEIHFDDDAFSGLANERKYVYPLNVYYKEMKEKFNITVYAYDLTQGTYCVTIYATDSAGNNATDSIYFVIDTEIPSLNLLSPAQGSIHEGGSAITIGGNAGDNTGIADCTISIPGDYHGAVILDPDSGIWSFTWYTRCLRKPNYNMTVTVSDKAGNIRTKYLVLYLDQMDPEIDMDDIPRYVSSNEFLHINWTVDDDTNITLIRIFLDDEEMKKWDFIHEDNWSYLLDCSGISLGKHDVRVEVTDQVGRIATAEAAIDIKQYIPPKKTEPQEDTDNGILGAGGTFVLIVFIIVIVLLLVLVFGIIFFYKRKKRVGGDTGENEEYGPELGPGDLEALPPLFESPNIIHASDLLRQAEIGSDDPHPSIVSSDKLVRRKKVVRTGSSP